MISKTLSPNNQFMINCPTFKVDTKLAACFALRDAVYRGDKPTVRIGCQCVVMSGKCPAVAVVDRMIREKDDPYFSAEPKVGRLDPTILDKVAPVIVTDSMMKRYPLSPSEEKLIAEANEYARSGKHQRHVAPRRAEKVVMEDVPTSTPATTPGPATNAAQTGDMAAAINAELAA
jgi:hypothetical protein